MGCGIREDGVYPFDNGLHILLHESPGSHGRSPDPYPGCLERSAGVERHHILVHGDVGLAELFFGNLPRKVREFAPEVYQHEVVVCPS